MKPPYNLRCEYLENPIEIDIPNPRFSWILEHEEGNQSQSAYQIIVSSEEKLLNEEKGDIWDSGKVYSRNSVNIEFQGTALKSNNKYYWCVKWWDKGDKQSNSSKIATFGTALLNNSDWSAKWISNTNLVNELTRRELQYKSQESDFMGRLLEKEFKEVHAIYLRKEFSIQKPVKTAKIYICGVGYYELRLNGKRIGDRVLEPAQTDYNKIALYSTYDITTCLENKNAVGVVLGNGRCIDLYGYDYPKLIAQIHILFTDGTIVVIGTDESWKVSNGPILENGIYHGEKFDARLEIPGWDNPEFEDIGWEDATVIKGYNLASQLMQPIQITKIMKPQQLSSPQPGYYVYDFGQNFTGFIRLKVQGPRGCQIKLRYAEILDGEGMLNTATNGNAPVTDSYILKGEGVEIFTPHFTYHGFRYVELTGFPGVPTTETIEGLFFHSNVPKAGDFFCSNELINKIHSNIIWGQLSNLMSIPTDCPQRDERQGWMGDAQLVTEEAMLNFDMARFYTKFLRDIKMCQREDGSISDVVPPYWPIYPADPAWGSAYITIAWYMYWYYNDIRILEDHYEPMKQYIDFLAITAVENISPLGRYGDWCPPSNIASKRTPLELVSTWYYYHDTFLFSKIAQILGFEQDFNDYSNRAQEIKNDFNKNFLLRTYKYIKVSPVDRAISQTSNTLPLYSNMVPKDKEKEILSYLVGAIRGHYDHHIDTGIIGTRYIFEVLTDNGYPEIAYKMITQKSFPGYGYMIREGATTLWERWEKLESSGMNSHNHIMLGSVDTWFYKTLVGIKSLEPGWNTLQIKPFVPNDMSYATASIETVKGRIYSAWEKIDNELVITLTIPVGCKAETWIPIKDIKNNIKEGDLLIWKDGEKNMQHRDIDFKELESNYVIVNLGSGYYKFTVQY